MESHLAEKIEVLIKKYSSKFHFAFLPQYTGVSFRIWQRNNLNNLQKVTDEFFIAMQPYAYGFDEDSLESVLAEILLDKKLSIATAESCTGGLIGKRLTDIAGSSKYFLGGITAYSNKLKIEQLDVSKNNLKKYLT